MYIKETSHGVYFLTSLASSRSARIKNDKKWGGHRRRTSCWIAHWRWTYGLHTPCTPALTLHTHTHTNPTQLTFAWGLPIPPYRLFWFSPETPVTGSGRTCPDSLCNPSGSWFYLTWLESHPGHLWNHPRLSLNKKRGKKILLTLWDVTWDHPAWSVYSSDT